MFFGSLLFDYDRAFFSATPSGLLRPLFLYPPELWVCWCRPNNPPPPGIGTRPADDLAEWLRERIADIPTRIIFESSLELMACTQLGAFEAGGGGVGPSCHRIGEGPPWPGYSNGN